MMTKLAVIAAAAGVLLAAPAFSTAARAEPLAGVKVAQVEVKLGDRHRHRHCRTTVVWKHGHKTVVRRCD